MIKYSFEEKVKIVTAYLNGEGTYKDLAARYGVKGTTQIKQWVNTFKVFGEGALNPKKNRKVYTIQTKLDAINLYITSQKSIREVANSMGITNSTLISEWIGRYREDGVDGLAGRKGYAPTMSKKDKKSRDAETGASKKDVVHIKELEKQIRLLQIENAYLKELRRLRRAEERAQMKWSQESSTTSEDPSN